MMRLDRRCQSMRTRFWGMAGIDSGMGLGHRERAFMARGLVPREVTVAEARGFVVRAGGLVAPWASTGEAIRHLGYVQMDPIDVCGKMHDLILRNRVAGYRRDGLLETLYAAGEREFFEHYIPGRGVLVALPVTEYRYLSRAMRARRTREGYGGMLDADQRRMARVILRRIRDEGPLGTGLLRTRCGRRRAGGRWVRWRGRRWTSSSSTGG